MKKIKILIVDDHPMMRDALLTTLKPERDLQVIGEASNGIEALKLAGELNPDVILIDLLMPKMGGLEAIAILHEKHPQIKIMVVTSLEDEEKVVAAIQAGALGYFPKTAPRTYLLEAIHKIADGIPYLPSGIALKLFAGLRALPEKNTKDNALTSRQEEILALIGEGHSDQEIGKILHLAVNTVRSHVHRILQRLGAGNRAQAVAYANKNRKTEKSD